MRRIFGQLGLFVLYGLLGGLLMFIVVAVLYLENRQDLDLWHSVKLEAEYHVDGGLAGYGDYLAMEEALFAEIDTKVRDRMPGGPGGLINRYVRDSMSSPDRWARNWNRSFELPVEAPVASVLMLHGMSDSPYSLSAVAERLHARGVHVLGLRYPGHGTIPASLTRTTWEDLYGAVQLAAQHLEQAAPGRPLYVFGYSTGAPLAVVLSLEALEDESLPLPDGLVLFSPAMGITPLAALTPWQARLGRLLGLEKLAWNSIEPEYDPFKYRSFPLNAALQVWRLSNHVDAALAEAEAAGRLERFPPILGFQSVVDNTIEARAVVQVLFGRLPQRAEGPDHSLVVYDFNRSTAIEPLLSNDPRPVLDQLLADSGRGYDFTVLSNRSEDTRAVSAVTGGRNGRAGTVCDLEAVWPEGVYSLAHIALPFPPDDPLYGAVGEDTPGRIRLGNVVLRGEAGALKVSAAGFLRQSFNPFFDYQFSEVLRFIGLEGPSACLGPHSDG